MFRLGRAVIVPGEVQQGLPVDNRDAAPLPFDDPALAETLEGDGDAGASRSKHEAEKVVRQHQHIAIKPVMRHQKPARQTPLYRTPAIGEHGGRDLAHEDVYRIQQTGSQPGAAEHEVADDRDRHHMAVPGAWT